MNHLMKKLFLIGVIFTLTSCGHTPIRILPEHIKSLYIPFFINQTFQYGLEEVMTNRVIEEFIKDGRLEVVDRELADTELKGTILSYQKVPFSYDKKGNINKYQVSIKVSFELRDLTTNKPLWQEEWQEVILYISPTSSYRPKEFELTSEEECKDKILSKIAYYIVSRIING